MKRRLVATLVAALVVSGGGLGAGTAHAADADFDGVIRGGGAYLWSYEGAATKLVLPATWKGKPVVSAELEIEKGTSVDVTRATSLRTLSLYGWKSKVTKLDLSKNTKLTSIHLEDLPLTSLSLSANKALKNLRLDRTKLTKLDLAKNTKLVSLYSNADPVKSVKLPKTKTLKSVGFYKTTKLKSLNVKNNTALAELTLAGSGLSKIDLTKNKALKVLDLGATKIKPASVRIPTGLTDLHLERNTTFTKLDLKKLTKLKVLNLRDTKLASVDLTKNTKLTKLALGGTFQKLDLTRNTALTELILGGQKPVTKVASLDLSKNSKLKYLSVYGSGLVSLNLTNARALDYLDLYQTSITKLDLSGLSKLEGVSASGNKKLTSLAFAGNSALEDVDVSDNALKSLDISSLKSLRYLNMAGNPGLAVWIDPAKNPRLDEVRYSPVDLSDDDYLPLGEDEGWLAQLVTNAK